MKTLRLIVAACLFAFGPAAAAAEELPQLRAAMLASGTVTWEISTIKNFMNSTARTVLS